MSVNEVVEGQKNEEIKPEDESKTVNYEELVERLNKLEGSNTRLLEESKGWKSKYKSLKEEVTTEKETQTMKKGSEDEKVKLLEEKYNNLKVEVSAERKKVLTKDLQLEVARHAKDAHNLDDIISNVSKMRDVVSLDDDSMSWSGVSDAVSKLRDEKTYLFKSDKLAGMENGRPSGGKPKEISVNNWGELTKEEKISLENDALKNFV